MLLARNEGFAGLALRVEGVEVLLQALLTALLGGLGLSNSYAILGGLHHHYAGV